MSGNIRLRAADFSAAASFGFVVNRDGVLTLVGDALHRRLGMRPGQHVDEVLKVVRPTRKTSFRELAVKPTATVVLRTTDGSNIELKGMTIAIDDGEQTGFFGTAVVTHVEEIRQRELMVSDFPPNDATPDLLLSMQATNTALTDARKLSSELEQALVKARAATEAKARFLAVISHEIRTPLNGFGSMIDLLRDSGVNDEQLGHLETMDLCARSLLVLVNDILDFSKLDAGKVEIHRAPTDLPQAIERMTDHFRALAKARGLRLEVVLELGEVRFVEMDYERVRQVLANLLGNALKFTLEGSITLRARATPGQTVTIDVIDSGVGIPEDEREGLFDPFVQADSSATRRFGGTGLGLSISRQLAGAMGGNVELIDSSEQGTQFRFHFVAPLCKGVDEPADAAADNGTEMPATFEGVSVLVAEDDATNRLIAKKMLARLGITPTLVNDGEQAVTAAAEQRYDLILMDVMMPNLNGIEATRRIRATSGPCNGIPIIAFTAAAFESDREQARAAGMTDFLDKPARLDGLRTIMRRHLPQLPATR